MKFQIECPNCKGIFTSEETELGDLIYCPLCDYAFEIQRRFVIDIA